jgi:peptidyl-dipeptidase A
MLRRDESGRPFHLITKGTKTFNLLIFVIFVIVVVFVLFVLRIPPMGNRSFPLQIVAIAGAVLCAGIVLERAHAQAGSDVERARAFVERAERQLLELNVRASRAGWVQSTFITVDTQQIAAEANEALTAATTALAREAAEYRDAKLPPDLARKVQLLRLQLTLPAPADPAKLAELTRIATSLEADYGRGKYCRGGRTDGNQNSGEAGDCLDVTAIERIMAESRDPGELLDVWKGWHAIGAPMRSRFVRAVQLTSEGARELGFDDTGALWRSLWDMPPDQFSAEVERLWQQVAPFYRSLHAYVRHRLSQHYGASVVPPNGPIPAHLLGNIWAQEWGHVYPLVAPADEHDSLDLTARLQARGYDALKMVRAGEAFFTSLGFAPLPQTFWERSLFVKPADRDVVCHASAWNIDTKEDVRLKMCIQVRDEDFGVIHHELGHNFYQLAYNGQPYLFQNSANAAFHEAVGDTIGLSITPEYLKKIGLIDEVPSGDDTGFLLRQALDKVAFLPFGMLIDQWRWRVFSGEITPERYNQAWWDLRLKYQGVAPPVPRSEEDFDPGAKYHVPANYPYVSYFLARVLQFQFHRALCQAAGETGPLYRCSIYQSTAAGDRLRRMLQMGASRPWPEALEVLTGTRQMDAGALLDYFAPLQKWLDEQNKGVPVGW